ncbi:hypothetical protein WJX79_010739 [Trebouxia sp. C0005]
MASRSQQYTISGISGEFLKDHDLIGKQDPYVIFEHGSQKVETSVIKSAGLNATWTESYTLEVASGQGSTGNEAKVMVYNKNLLADGLIGQGTFTLSSGPQRVVLLNKKGLEQGQVVFNLSGGSGSGAAGGASRSSGMTTATTGAATTGAATTGAATTTTKTECVTCQETTTTSAGQGPICDTKTFTKVEDRPIVKEVKTYVREHHPVEKEFVVETKPTGAERELTEGRTSEYLSTEEKIVEITKPNPCGGVPTS